MAWLPHDIATDLEVFFLTENLKTPFQYRFMAFAYCDHNWALFGEEEENSDYVLNRHPKGNPPTPPKKQVSILFRSHVYGFLQFLWKERGIL